MKVLFLDIDGVLNCDSTKEKLTTVFGDFTGVDARHLARLKNWLAGKDDLSIVLSSSWRLDGRYDKAFTNKLKELGLSWISETPNIGHRGKEIATWLDENDCTHYAIIDDMSDMHPVGAALVQTSSHDGLQDKHLKKLDKLLGYDTSY